jgi:hypothetical protein
VANKESTGQIQCHKTLLYNVMSIIRVDSIAIFGLVKLDLEERVEIEKVVEVSYFNIKYVP